MPSRRTILFWTGLSAALLVSRLAHRNILWADEDYHLASAIQVLWAKIPYRDFWYDKPPLNLFFYVLFGARTGPILRIAGALFETGCCVLLYRFASQLWSRREGYIAAGFLGFFLIFYLPAGVIPLEPDSLMLAPHLAAVYCAWKRRPLAAGLLSGIAFLFNTKAVFVLAACAVFDLAGVGWLILGFLLPNTAFFVWLGAAGALPGYLEQVWRWGFRYSGAARAGVATLFGWLGFHAALVLGTCWWWIHRESGRWKFAVWAALSLAGVAIGWRFAPRYFLQLLPVFALLAARGVMIPRNTYLRASLLAAGLLLPAVRFGPRYGTLLAEDFRGPRHQWLDVAMDSESQDAARLLESSARPGDTVVIWGYRPNVIAYSRLAVGARLWDSQPLTGVPADRHLSDATPVDADWASQNRKELARSSPQWIVDGLSAYNPALDIHKYTELTDWLSHYCEAGKPGLITLYRRCR
jgi:hypothetical protein